MPAACQDLIGGREGYCHALRSVRDVAARATRDCQRSKVPSRIALAGPARPAGPGSARCGSTPAGARASPPPRTGDAGTRARYVVQVSQSHSGSSGSRRPVRARRPRTLTRPRRKPRGAVPAVPRRRDAVEQVHAARDSLEQIRRKSDTHKITGDLRAAGPARARSSTRCITGFGSPTESPPMAMPVHGPRCQGALERAEPEVVVGATLDDGPERLRVAIRRVAASSRAARRHRSSQRSVRSMPSRASSYGAWPGTTWSNCHRDVGAEGPLDLHRRLGRERARRLPSTWLWNVDAVLRRCWRSPSSEKTWKPPESVSIGRSQCVKRWRPPMARDDVLARAEVQVIGVAEDDLRAGAAARRRDCRPRTTPWVPTGMKAGVRTVPCGSVRVPARAAPSGALEGEVAHRTDRSHVLPGSGCGRSAADAPGRARAISLR